MSIFLQFFIFSVYFTIFLFLVQKIFEIPKFYKLFIINYLVIQQIFIVLFLWSWSFILSFFFNRTVDMSFFSYLYLNLFNLFLVTFLVLFFFVCFILLKNLSFSIKILFRSNMIVESSIISQDKLAYIVAGVLMYIIYTQVHFPIQELTLQFLDNTGTLRTTVLKKEFLEGLLTEWRAYKPNEPNLFNFHAELPKELIVALGIDPNNKGVIINEVVPKLIFLSKIKHTDEFIFFPTKVTEVQLYNINYIKGIANLNDFIYEFNLILQGKQDLDLSVYNLSSKEKIYFNEVVTKFKKIYKKEDTSFLFIIDDNLIGYNHMNKGLYILQKNDFQKFNDSFINFSDPKKISLSDIIFVSKSSCEVTRVIELKTFTGNVDFIEQRLTEFSRYSSEVHVFLDTTSFETLKSDIVRFEAIRAKFINIHLHDKSSITLSDLKIYPKSFFNQSNVNKGTPYTVIDISLKSAHFLINNSLKLLKH